MALIETINRRTYYGQYRMDGVVAIYTQAGDAYRDALAPSALVAPTGRSPERIRCRSTSPTCERCCTGNRRCRSTATRTDSRGIMPTS